MSPLQFRRWYDFARRMALRGIPNITPARRKRLADELKWFFWVIEDGKGEIQDWDSSPAYIGDRVSHLFDEKHYHEKFLKNGRVEPRDNRFLGLLECCIRAGLDMASAPSAGVIGFDVSDLRRMYPLGIPAWLNEGFTAPITAETAGNSGVWL